MGVVRSGDAAGTWTRVVSMLRGDRCDDVYSGISVIAEALEVRLDSWID